MKNKNKLGLAGLLFLANLIPEEVLADENSKCNSKEDMQLTQLADDTKKADGNTDNKKDGKLSPHELAEYNMRLFEGSYDQLLDKQRKPTKPTGEDKKGFGFSVGEATRDIAVRRTTEEFSVRYDTNNDGFITQADDLDEDGVITCKDAESNYARIARNSLKPKYISLSRPEGCTALRDKNALSVVIISYGYGESEKMEKVLGELAPNYNGKIKFYNMLTNTSGELELLDECLNTGKMNIYPNPAIILVKEGKVVGRYVGRALNRNQLERMIDNKLGVKL